MYHRLLITMYKTYTLLSATIRLLGSPASMSRSRRELWASTTARCISLFRPCRLVLNTTTITQAVLSYLQQIRPLNYDNIQPRGVNYPVVTPCFIRLSITSRRSGKHRVPRPNKDKKARVIEISSDDEDIWCVAQWHVNASLLSLLRKLLFQRVHPSEAFHTPQVFSISEANCAKTTGGRCGRYCD